MLRLLAAFGDPGSDAQACGGHVCVEHDWGLVRDFGSFLISFFSLSPLSSPVQGHHVRASKDP